MAAENKKDGTVSTPALPDLLGGPPAGPGSDLGSPTPAGPGPGPDPSTPASGATNTDEHGDISAGTAGRGSGNGEQPATRGSGTTDSGAGDSQTPASRTRRPRQPRTPKPDTTPAGETQTAPELVQLAAPISINLTTGRKRKAQTITIKPDTIADVLVLGFGELEKFRGAQWKRTKAECLPFAKAVSELVPELPPELLKTIEKTSPWLSLVFTGAFLFGPGLVAEYHIAKYKEHMAKQEKTQREELARRQNQPGYIPQTEETLTSGNQTPAQQDTTDGTDPASPLGGGAGETSGGGVSASPSTNDTIGEGVSPFGKFGNAVV